MNKNDLPQPLYLTVPDAAKLCGVSRNTLYTWVRKGKLSAYQTPGRTNLIRPSDLMDFMRNSGLFVPPKLEELAQRDEVMNEQLNGGKKSDDSSLRSIVVVDDDPLVRSLMVRALNDVYRLYQARTGFEALHMLTLHEDIRMVLLDLRMPGQHGLNTLKEIKKLRPQIPVIVVTGYAGEIPLDEHSRAQIARVMVKPFSVAMLKEAIREVERSLSGRHGDEDRPVSHQEAG